jgi:hypothetical protein
MDQRWISRKKRKEKEIDVSNIIIRACSHFGIAMLRDNTCRPNLV